MAYGWPQVIPLELPTCTSRQQIIYLKIVNRLLLVVSPTHLELWSSSQVRDVSVCISSFVNFRENVFIDIVFDSVLISIE